MLTSPRTLLLAALAVLLVGCSDATVQKVAQPVEPSTVPVGAALPVIPAEDLALDDNLLELPAAHLPEEQWPEPEFPQPRLPTRKLPSSESHQRESTAVTRPSTRAVPAPVRPTRVNERGTPIGLPSLPGISPPPHAPGRLNAEVLPGLPGSRNPLPKGLPGFPVDEAG